LRRVLPGRKGHAVNPDQKASADLAKAEIWSEDSLVYARERDQRKLVWLLGEVKADIEFEGSLRSLPSRGRLRLARGGYRGAATHDNDRKTDEADDARRRTREEEKYRAHLASWKRFMDSERRELELRKDGELGRLLGEPQLGESPAALERLVGKDRRQAEDGLVALMSMGKVFYKHLSNLCPEDMPARAAASRLRTTWLKERRDAWLPSISGGHG
jgi:hypothetical protein